ncbi:hypothetical protein Tco_1509663 [Tanacetum coccineum]
MGLWYSKDIDMSLTAYADAYHTGCQDTRCSTSGSTQFLGDKLVSWSSKNQKSTTISSTEAELLPLSWMVSYWSRLDALPKDEEIKSFLKRNLVNSEVNQFTTMMFIVLIQMHQPRENFLLSFINRSLFGKTTSLDKLLSPEHKSFLGRLKVRREAPLPPQLTTVLVSPEEPTRKSKRVKRPAKKSTKSPTGGVVIRETPEMSSFWNGSGTFTKTAPSDAKIKPSVTNERTGVKPGVLDVTEEVSTKSEPESWVKDEDDNNNEQDTRSEERSDSEHETDENESGSESDQEENEEEIGDDKEEKEDEFVKTPSNNSDDEDEIKITDKAEGDEDKEMDYTTSQLYDDVDIRLNKLVQADDETVQKEGTDAEMINKTDVPVTSFSHSFDLATKFLNFADIPTTKAKIISPMDVPVYHEVPSG